MVNVPLEFGNKEQIEILDKVNSLLEGALISIRESSLDDKPFFTEIKCVCGSKNKRYWDNDSLDRLENKHFKFKCCGCDLNYTLKQSDFSEFMLVLKINP